MRAGPAAALCLLLAFASCGGGGPAPVAAAPASRPAAIAPTAIFPDGHRVSLRLATEPQAQALGLMYVEALPDGEGMLFLFPEDSQRTFWMKNCKIPLDMIWLDSGNRVVDITEEAPPCAKEPCPQYGPRAAMRNVLEVRGGLSKAHGLRAGDTVVILGADARGESGR